MVKSALGKQRLVLLARTTTSKPTELLILDEPVKV